ncbi:MAG TPA: HAMP domain-containing sensor histidine kinase [Ohtaekwangia sp.]
MSTPSEIWRLFYLYQAEFVLGLVLFITFRHFGSLYRRRFLYTWSFSWLMFALFSGFSGIIILILNFPEGLTRTGISILTQMTCYFQVILILRGTYELVYERAFNRRMFRVIVAIVLLVATVAVLLFSGDQSRGAERYLLRVGSRSFVMGLGFLITGLVVFRHKRFTRGFGQRLLTVSFVIFGLYQIYYFSVVFMNVFFQRAEFPIVFGVVDLLLIALMGMSMVMWLLEDEREKLEKANNELDRFLYSTSHDLRAPIASILGLTYLGKIEFQEERARLFMDMIESRIKKLDMVISDILSLSRSKKLDAKIQPIDLKILIDDTITDIKFNKGASDIALEYEAGDHQFHSDYNQMKIIMANLMSNAVKYHNLNQPTPFIKIAFSRNKDCVSIAVQDNGKGIPPESLPKIFEMFYRASLDTEGTGLGLYIVKEALSKIKGTIEVKSELNKGSTFTITLENA